MRSMKRSREPEIMPHECVSDPDGGKTSPTLLDRVRDWKDHPAWLRFHGRYNPLLRLWCRRFGLDDDASDELCQRIWVELMGRMRTFRYDPSRGFRDWLWRLFRSRAIDLLRHRRVTMLLSLDGLSSEDRCSGRLRTANHARDGREVDEEASLIFLQQAAEAQGVRPIARRSGNLAAPTGSSRSRTNRCGRTAESLGKSYTAVYSGYKRVDRMLRAEGERRLAELSSSSARSPDGPDDETTPLLTGGYTDAFLPFGCLAGPARYGPAARRDLCHARRAHQCMSRVPGQAGAVWRGMTWARIRPQPRLPGLDKPPVIPGFEIECELGRGGMGVVYQAFEPSLGRRVALKVVRSGPSSGSNDQERWLREARSFARVRHDNVVRLYQVGEAEGWLYMVLELVPGGTLEQRLKVPYAPKDAALLLETIARAVVAIHREGLVHLDLKPSNILLDAGPETPRELAVPRVGDFGIAVRSDEPDAEPGDGNSRPARSGRLPTWRRSRSRSTARSSARRPMFMASARSSITC